MKRRYQHIKLLTACLLALFYLPFVQASELQNSPVSPLPQQQQVQLPSPIKLVRQESTPEIDLEDRLSRKKKAQETLSRRNSVCLNKLNLEGKPCFLKENEEIEGELNEYQKLVLGGMEVGRLAGAQVDWAVMGLELLWHGKHSNGRGFSDVVGALGGVVTMVVGLPVLAVDMAKKYGLPQKQDVINVGVATAAPLALRGLGALAGASSAQMLSHNAYLAGSIPAYYFGKKTGQKILQNIHLSDFVQRRASRYQRFLELKRQLSDENFVAINLDDRSLLGNLEDNPDPTPARSGGTFYTDPMGCVCYNLAYNTTFRGTIEYGFGFIFLGIWAVACYIKFGFMGNQTLVEHLITNEKGGLCATTIGTILGATHFLPSFYCWLFRGILIPATTWAIYSYSAPDFVDTALSPLKTVVAKTQNTIAPAELMQRKETQIAQENYNDPITAMKFIVAFLILFALLFASKKFIS